MAKRKTLVKEFEEFVKNGDEEAIKKVFETCDINAYGGYEKGNAFFFQISYDMMKWLLEQGADIEYVNQFHYTPLFYHAGHSFSERQALDLIELGADINYVHPAYKTTVLHQAVSARNIELVKVLLDKGADVSAVNFGKDTPLEAAFNGATTMDITQIFPVAEYLLSHGAEVTDKLKQYMREDAERIEFLRDRISSDVISEVNEALDKLYKLIDIEPVPKHESYDGKTRIAVKEKTWQKQHGELWNLLVPGAGPANTVQGEVIRITGRVTYELLDNGGANWDGDYRKMEKALLSYVKMGNSMEGAKYKELKGIVSKGSKASDDMLNRMTELCVEWVTFNLDPIPVGEVVYRR